MLEVWTWPTPNGHKVHIALEELGLEYKVIPIDIGAGDQFKPEFLKITPNPLRQRPSTRRPRVLGDPGATPPYQANHRATHERKRIMPALHAPKLTLQTVNSPPRRARRAEPWRSRPLLSHSLPRHDGAKRSSGSV
jgi:hypothetical protein